MKAILEFFTCLFFAFLLEGSNGKTFTIVHPKMFRIDAEETVVVNLHGYGNQAVTVTAQLADYPRRKSIFGRVNVIGNANEAISFNVQVSRNNIMPAQTILNKKVELQVSVNVGSETVQKDVIIYLTGETDYIFIQTERPIYRPKEEVQIRVIPLNVHMHPLTSHDEGVEIIVQTPDQIGVWKDIKRFPRGAFIEVTYEIPDYPPLGVWRVVAKVNNTLHTSVKYTEFKVDKYVLPTYDVSVDLTQSFVKPNESISGTLEAKYSYGEPVIGVYLLNCFVQFPDSDETFEFYRRPSTYLKRPGMLQVRDKGSKSFTIPTHKATDVTGRSWEELISMKATITIRASVLGQAEGILESDERRGILITNSPYLIDMSHTSRFFVPATAHTVNVIVRDVVTKLPVPEVQIKVIKVGSPDIASQTDDRGTAQVLVDMPRNQNQIQIKIRTADSRLAEDHQADEDFVMTKYVSRSGAYLRIREAPSHADVDSIIYVRFQPYNARPSQIQYIVLAQGMIIVSGRKTVTGGEASQRLPITRKMSPGIRVIGYYIEADEIISDSVSIDVSEACHSKELEISVNADSVKPDDIVTVSFQGEGNALVGLSAVDRAAYFLFGDGRLNREKMFDQIKSFDLGCSMAGGSNGLNVFEEAGLACTEKSRSTPSVSELTCPGAEGDEDRKKRSASVIDPDLQILESKCLHDGKYDNLAGEDCHIRKLRIKKWGYDEEKEQICFAAFLEGCELGVAIREEIAFRRQLARTAQVDAGSHLPNVRRERFKEGWLWGTHTLKHSGRGSKSDNAPHSITTYDIDAISVHQTEGFCVAKPAQVKVFKDFFLQLYLPYSVKVMEQVQIRAALFNYHETKERTVLLRIKGDENLCTHSEPGEWYEMATLTIASQSSTSFSFTVIPLRVPLSGQVEIEVESIPLTDRDQDAQDSIIKQLNVEEAGTQEEFSGSFILDPEARNPGGQIEFLFPDDNVVPESKKCWVYGHMSFLGPIIEFDPIGETPKNLVDSISLPHGCGEQNMFSCGPNAFAYKYLQSKGDPKASTRQEIQTYIIDGYTIQQTHRSNGVWSVYSSRQPTIWLNAYVNKVFLHSRRVWPDMDMQPICASMDWMLNRQQSDGRFSEGRLAHYYKINVAEGGDKALTAYVLSAISETEIPCQNANLKSRIPATQGRAAEYLRTTVGETDIPYTYAIVAYALALVHPTHSSTNTANGRLMRARIDDGNEIYWLGPSNAVPNMHKRNQLPIDIETTAYALLAQVTIARSQGSSVLRRTVDTINKIARWLVLQQNYKGGIQSSQTTAVAIQAITEYGIWIDQIEPPPRNPHLNAVLTAAGTSWSQGHDFAIDESNEFYKKEEEIPKDVFQGTRNVNVAVTGEGRGRMSYRCIYRLTRDSEICDFNITAKTEMVGYVGQSGKGEAAPGKGKHVMKLLLVISKLSAPASSMAIVEISFISGFRPIEATLDAITRDTVVDGAIDRYEISNQKVIIYVDKIAALNGEEQPLRIAFNFLQDVVVNRPNPAKILVYDYYKPEDTCGKFYAVPDGSPMLQTICSPGSIDNLNQQQCKCAEGGCPKCRKREEQLTKTCGKRRACNNACRDEDDCLNLHRSVCDRNFGYMAEVRDIDMDSMPGFVKMTASVKEIVHTKSSDTGLKTEEIRTFTMRKDCYEQCHDEELLLKNANDGNYFVVGRTFLIRGRKPEKATKSAGQQEFTYYLDQDAILERTMTKEKCDKIAKKRKSCEGSRTDKCRQVQKRLKICDNQDVMRRAVIEGCD